MKFMKFEIQQDLRHTKSEYDLRQLFYLRAFGKTDIIILHSVQGPSYATLPPMQYHVHKLYFAQSKCKSVSSTYFISVFHTLFWISILTVYFLLIVFLIIYKRLHNLSFNQFCEITLHVTGISSEIISYSTFSFHLCSIIFLFLFYILSESFSAFLTTELAVATEPKPPFEHLEDLASQSKYKICVKPYSNIYSTMYEQKKYQHILNDIDCDNFFESIDLTTEKKLLDQLCQNPHLTIILEENEFNTGLRYIQLVYI